MRHRYYGQYCGLTRAMELVGERWALLVIRDLAVRPRRYSLDLTITYTPEGLPSL
jgi:DNA-binding HxlR family transcriptional regulator